MSSLAATTGRPRIAAYVISWTGHGDAARAIAAGLVGHVDRLVVVYSNAAGTIEDGPGEWVQVPNEYFYGMKFLTTLRDFDADLMLQVQADASSDDWPGLVARCRDAFAARPALGVWTPLVDWTYFDLGSILIAREPDGICQVTRTDSVVWALSAPMCDALRDLDLTRNTFGWGIDSAASAIAHNRGLEVVVDLETLVGHPQPSAYDQDAAYLQGQEFLQQLGPGERRSMELFRLYQELRVAERLGLPSRAVKSGRAVLGRLRRRVLAHH